MEPASPAVLILLVGAVVVLAIALRAALARTVVPALVTFIALGTLIGAADQRLGFLGSDGEAILDLLAQLGVIALLFRVGLESDLRGLVEQLPRASLVWVGNVVLSAVPGYFVMSAVLGYGPVPSLVAATALTATSVGVSLGMWAQHDALRTRKGELLTDVAELDDLSGIAFMALLFAVLPLLAEGAREGALLPAVLSAAGVFALKLAGFSLACVLVGRFVERRVTARLKRRGSPSELMVFVAGVGIVIAGVAELIGISAAIGALFAGIIFSRDPEAVKIDAGFHGVYHLLTPFFFVGVGLGIEAGAIGSALGAGLALTTVAILGKVVGAGLPALLTTSAAGAGFIAVSMVPRAEISMIIMSRGAALGDWVVPPELYAAFVLVSATTCLLAPITLEILFRRFPEAVKDAATAPPEKAGA